MQSKFKQLESRLREIFDLNAAGALLYWDQATYMPPGGNRARSRQLALLGRLAHERATDPELGDLIGELTSFEEQNDYDSYEASLIRVARRDFHRAVQVPSEFAHRFTEHTSQSYEAWTKARPESDFSIMVPYLEKTLELSREFSGFYAPYDHVADPLIAESDYGMSTESIKSVFGDLRRELVPFVEQLTSSDAIDRSPVTQEFDEGQQLAFGGRIIADFGYDFERGRQDKTHHPFMTKFSLGDVRITTRSQPDDLTEALFSTLHEAGHAIYEQGIDQSLEGTPLARGASSGTHESQSRLWENLVGRSLGFWEHYYPQLQNEFKAQLEDVDLEDFYRAINAVERSLIRTDADEVTYNLHVMIRFDLELALLEGSLDIADLADAWMARYQADLGIEPPDHKDGVLQDVHWYAGPIGGAFQGYTLGNVMSAQILDTVLDAEPGVRDEIKRGEFDTLRGWLQENMYRHGRKFTADETVNRVTGRELSIEPYLDYLRTKFGTLYDLS